MMSIEEDMIQKNLMMKQLIENTQMMIHMKKEIMEIMKEEEKDIEEFIEIILEDLYAEVGVGVGVEVKVIIKI